MLSKCIKLLTISILVLCVTFSIMHSYVYADYSSEISTALSTVDQGKDTDASASVNNIVTVVISITRIIGVTVAIVLILVVAMKYMTAAPGEKADIKKSAVVYIVGAVVLFAVTGILGIINEFAGNIKAEGASTPGT